MSCLLPLRQNGLLTVCNSFAIKLSFFIKFGAPLMFSDLTRILLKVRCVELDFFSFVLV